MRKLTADSAREFLESEFWKDWQELTSQLTYERWRLAKAPAQQQQLRLQIEHMSTAEEALIRLSCSDRKPGDGPIKSGTQVTATMN